MIRLVALFLLLALVQSANAVGFNGYRGLWYDRAHPGHGIDVQQVGTTYLVVLYTFGADGEPEWLAAQGPVVADVFEQDLLRFGYDHATSTARVTATVGRLAMRWNATADAPACAGTSRAGAAELVVLEVRIGAERVDWCLEPLLPAQVLPETGMSGSWWGGADDSGWGLATYFIPVPNASTHSVHVLYHYDAAGAPRWVYAETDDTDFELATRWQSYRGYCRTCAPAALVARDAGPLALTLSTPRRGAGLGNRIDEAATYPGAAGGTWARRGELQRFSDLTLYGGTVATREGLIAPDIFHDDSNHDVYLGIPYAAPPTGANRFRAPQPAPARTRVLDVVARTPGCPQNPAVGVFGGEPASTSEDCLTLNVWVPVHPRRRPLPVMVWIHGGGFIQGGALHEAPVSELLVYDGAQLATRDVIVVTVNYRLGPFGFLAVRELLGEQADYPATGNYGFLDQVAALAWVRDNIAEFGGDAGNVTIFGESAGGVSVCGHVASPLSRGLFHRAIMQSGNCLNAMPHVTQGSLAQPAAVEQGARVAARLGCNGAGVAACLRAAGTTDLLEAGRATISFQQADGETYGLVRDGFAFDRTLGAAIADGSAAGVPFVIGVNEDEATTLVPAALRPASAAGYEALVRARFPQIANQVLARYPASDYTPVWRAWTAIVSDVAFICPARRAARDHAARGRSTYAYYFTQDGLGELAVLGAFHAAEIPYLFNVLAPQDAGAAALADRMRDAWTTFAATGVPQAVGFPVWPTHGATGALGMQLDGAGDSVVADYRAAYCDFWALYIAL